MNRKILLAGSLIGLLIALAARAEDDLSSVCQIQEPAWTKSIPLSFAPAYFYKNLPSGEGAFMDVPNGASGGEQNVLFNFQTGKSTPVPSFRDAVPTPDGKLMVTQIGTPSHRDAFQMAFYTVNGIKSDSKPAFMDGQVGGYYQSTAILSKTGGQTTYRMLVESGDDKGPTLMIRDYIDPPTRLATVDEIKKMFADRVDTVLFHIQFDDDPSIREKYKDDPNFCYWYSDTPGKCAEIRKLGQRIAAAHTREEIEKIVTGQEDNYLSAAHIGALDRAVEKSGPKKICTNLPPGSIKTPMLSKLGTMVAGFNVKTQTTVVLYLDAQTGNCSETLNGDPSTKIDLGRPTGKIDFSFDDKKIAFHSQGASPPNAGPEEDRWIGLPDREMVANAYVYDIPSHQITPITHTGSDSYLYPTFFADGKLSVLRHNKVSDGAPQRAELYIYDPAKESRSIDIAKLPTGGGGKSSGMTGSGQCVLEPGSPTAALTALGSVVGQLCLKDYGYQADADSALLALGVSKKSCEKIASHWRQGDAALGQSLQRASLNDPALFRQIQPKDILAICNSLQVESKKASELKPPTLVPIKRDLNSIKEIFKNRCQKCHEDGGPGGHIPFDNPALIGQAVSKSAYSSTSTLLDEMIKRVAQDRVPPPPGIPLSGSDKASILHYLRCLKPEYASEAACR